MIEVHRGQVSLTAPTYCCSNTKKSKLGSEHNYIDQSGEYHEIESTSEKGSSILGTVIDGITKPFRDAAHKFCVIPSYFVSLADFFSPLVSFTNKFLQGNIDKNDISVDEFKKMVGDVVSKINSNEEIQSQLSGESKDALNNLTQVLSQVSNENVTNQVLASLIRRWRQNRGTRALFKMARLIENGGCLHGSEEELRERFVRALTTLAQAIEEARQNPNHPNSPQAEVHLTKAADHTVNGVERQEQASNTNGGALTQEDRNYIGSELKQAEDEISTVTNNPSLSSVFNYDTLALLQSLYEFLSSFLKSWYKAREEEERREEEIKEQERLCQQRNQRKSDYLKYKAKYYTNKTKSYFHGLRRSEAENKLNIFLRLKRFLQARRGITGLHHYLKSEINKYRSIYLEALSSFKESIGLSYYYRNIKHDVKEEMPPSTACEENLRNLELDLAC